MLYGWENISHEILCNGLSREEAIANEKQLIAAYDATNPVKGYNLMTGGDGIGTHTERTRALLRELNLGRTWTEERKERQRKLMLGHTLSDESRERIRSAKLGTKNSAYGTHKTEEEKERIRAHMPDRRGGKSVLARPVNQIGADGNMIAIFDSIATAARENGIKSAYNITACIRGRQATCGGFAWKYADAAR